MSRDQTTSEIPDLSQVSMLADCRVSGCFDLLMYAVTFHTGKSVAFLKFR